jgi:hypothetical protein
MNVIIIAILMLVILVLLCKKQESYYNVFGMWVDGPSDENYEGINMDSPIYSLSRTPYYWWWHKG